MLEVISQILSLTAGLFFVCPFSEAETWHLTPMSAQYYLSARQVKQWS